MTAKTLESPVLNMEGKSEGKVSLRGEIFGLEPSREFLHEFVSVYSANQRAGSANTKTRGEVSGGGHKPWKQKHTGRARAGSNRSPLWRHGGIVFGPRAGVVRLDFPRRKARKALAQALSARFAAGDLVFVSELAISEAKTKLMAALLGRLGVEPSGALIVLDKPDAAIVRAGRNIPGLAVVLAKDLNAYAVLRSRRLVMTSAALENLGARWN